MLGWSLTFLALAVLAALLGFTTVAGVSYVAAKALFFAFLVLFVFSLMLGDRRSSDFV